VQLSVYHSIRIKLLVGLENGKVLYILYIIISSMICHGKSFILLTSMVWVESTGRSAFKMTFLDDEEFPVASLNVCWFFSRS
jgi:hypothetical protein